jgi:hypothetical protein
MFPEIEIYKPLAIWLGACLITTLYNFTIGA